MSMRSVSAVVVVCLLIVGLATADVDAAQRGKAKGKANNAPSFCRSGAGHPVYGRQWCLDKGHGLGESEWRRAHFDKVAFKKVPEGRIEAVPLGAREIAEILTDVALDAIFGASQFDLDRSELGGAWRGGSSEGLFVLEVAIGGSPVAELTDTDLDGEVDVVLIFER